MHHRTAKPGNRGPGTGHAPSAPAEAEAAAPRVRIWPPSSISWLTTVRRRSPPARPNRSRPPTTSISPTTAGRVRPVRAEQGRLAPPPSTFVRPTLGEEIPPMAKADPARPRRRKPRVPAAPDGSHRRRSKACSTVPTGPGRDTGPFVCTSEILGYLTQAGTKWPTRASLVVWRAIG